MITSFPAHVRARRAARTLAASLALAGALGALQGCTALVVGGAMVGGALMFTDRRSTGAQVDDEAIELKAGARVRELGVGGNVSATSYNRTLLLTGELAREADRQAVEQTVARIDNVRSVVNEIAIGEAASVASRTNDSVISGKVKASFVDAKDVQAQAAKVVTERGVVFLMGRVSEREAQRYADIARTVPGVRKVVRVFEIVSDEELARIQPK